MADFDWFAWVPVLISLGMLVFVARQADAARKQAEVSRAQSAIATRQADSARKALSQARLLSLFSSFDAANQAALDSPELLYSVHGLDRTVPREEARSIAYLSVILDGYQKYFSDLYGSDCSAALEVVRMKSTFLNRIFSMPANQERWLLIRDMFYGDFDRDFVGVIDGLIAHECAAASRQADRSSIGPE